MPSIPSMARGGWRCERHPAALRGARPRADLLQATAETPQMIQAPAADGGRGFLFRVRSSAASVLCGNGEYAAYNPDYPH